MYWSRETRSIANESNAKTGVFPFPRISSSITTPRRGAQLTRMAPLQVQRVLPMRVTPAGWLLRQFLSPRNSFKTRRAAAYIADQVDCDDTAGTVFDVHR